MYYTCLKYQFKYQVQKSPSTATVHKMRVALHTSAPELLDIQKRRKDQYGQALHHIANPYSTKPTKQRENFPPPPPKEKAPQPNSTHSRKRNAYPH
jgi:hypothetical protein